MQLPGLFRRGADLPREADDADGFSVVEVSGVSPEVRVKELDEQACSIVQETPSDLSPTAADSRPGFWHTVSNTIFWSKPLPALPSSEQARQEPFSISRESFDSYRRSVDTAIPVSISHINSNTFNRASIASNYRNLTDCTTKTVLWSDGSSTSSDQDDGFEEVDLDESDADAAPRQSNRRSLWLLAFSDGRKALGEENIERPASASSSLSLSSTSSDWI